MRVCALLATLLAGCTLTTDGYAPLAPVSAALVDGAVATADWGGDGLVVGPEHTAVRVGEELEFFLALDEASALRPASLPGGARFEDDSDGGWLLWAPTATEIGRHVVVFLVVDAAAPNVVLAQRTVIVDVLPANGLIEYGF